MPDKETLVAVAGVCVKFPQNQCSGNYVGKDCKLEVCCVINLRGLKYI